MKGFTFLIIKKNIIKNNNQYLYALWPDLCLSSMGIIPVQGFDALLAPHNPSLQVYPNANATYFPSYDIYALTI